MQLGRRKRTYSSGFESLPCLFSRRNAEVGYRLQSPVSPVRFRALPILRGGSSVGRAGKVSDFTRSLDANSRSEMSRSVIGYHWFESNHRVAERLPGERCLRAVVSSDFTRSLGANCNCVHGAHGRKHAHPTTSVQKGRRWSGIVSAYMFDEA